MLPGVNVVAVDGGLGIVGAGVAGRTAKVGLGSLIGAEEIKLLASAGEVATAIGVGPLADACRESFAAGARTLVVCGAEVGAAGEIIDSELNTEEGTIEASGEPTARVHLRVQITTEGEVGLATFRWSIDGKNWSGNIVVPASPTSYTIETLGITLTFDALSTYFVGDQLDVWTEPPLMSVETATDAIDALLASEHLFELVHVVGASDASFWTVCKQRAETTAGAQRWLFFVCEASWPDSDTEDWVTETLAEANAFQSNRVAVVAGHLTVVDSTGAEQPRNGAATYVGRLASVPVQRSPGRVLDGPLPVLGLWPEDLNDGHIQALDEAGFVTFRQFANTNAARGVFVTRGLMLAGSSSDYLLVQNRRAMDKALWLVRERALPFLQSEADVAPDGSTPSLDRFAAVLQGGLEIMINAGEIAAGEVTIPLGQDLLATQTLNVVVSIQPRGYLNNIEVKIGFTSGL